MGRPKSQTATVLDTIIDLFNQEILVTPDTIAEASGLSMQTILNAINDLMMSEKICRVGRGVYIPMFRHPPSRCASRTILPDGTTKLEVGDDVLTLTPKESRMVAELMQSGFSQVFQGSRIVEITEKMLETLKQPRKQPRPKAPQRAKACDTQPNLFSELKQ